MTENRFLDAVSNIDADVVESFIRMDEKLQSKPKKRYGKAIKWGVAVAACVTVAVCAGVVAQVVDSFNVEYTVYHSGDDCINSIVLKQDVNENGLILKTQKSNEINFYSSADKIDDPDAKQEIKIKLNGKTITGHYFATEKIKAPDSIDEDLEKFRIYYHYLIYEEGTDITRGHFNIRKSTGELIEYSNMDEASVPGDCVAMDAKAIADDLIYELYDAKYVDEYTYKETKFQSGTTSLPRACYRVTYVRTLYGHEVDTIAIDVNRAGRIAGIYAQDIGKFYKIEKKVSRRAIQKAYETLIEYMEVEYREMTTENVCLRLASDGKLYLEPMFCPSWSRWTILTINVN